MKRSHIFTAEDGTTFATGVGCKHYEEIGKLECYLSNLNPFAVRSALERTHVELADAFERAATLIAAKRRESGELKRAAKKVADPKAAMEQIEENMKAIS